MKDLFKVIMSPVIARQLLKMGNPIVDIKPNKNEERATVFIFENTEKLNRDFSTIYSK